MENEFEEGSLFMSPPTFVSVDEEGELTLEWVTISHRLNILFNKTGLAYFICTTKELQFSGDVDEEWPYKRLFEWFTKR